MADILREAVKGQDKVLIFMDSCFIDGRPHLAFLEVLLAKMAFLCDYRFRDRRYAELDVEILHAHTPIRKRRDTDVLQAPSKYGVVVYERAGQVVSVGQWHYQLRQALPAEPQRRMLEKCISQDVDCRLARGRIRSLRCKV